MHTILYRRLAITVSTVNWATLTAYSRNRIIRYASNSYITLTDRPATQTMTPDVDDVNYSLYMGATSGVTSMLLDTLGEILVFSNGQREALSIGTNGQILARVGNTLEWDNAVTGAARQEYDSPGFATPFSPRESTEIPFYSDCLLTQFSNTNTVYSSSKITSIISGQFQNLILNSSGDSILRNQTDTTTRRVRVDEAVTRRDLGFINDGKFYRPPKASFYSDCYEHPRMVGGVNNTTFNDGNLAIHPEIIAQLTTLNAPHPGTGVMLNLGTVDTDFNWGTFATNDLYVIDYIRTKNDTFIFLCETLSNRNALMRTVWAIGGAETDVSTNVRSATSIPYSNASGILLNAFENIGIREVQSLSFMPAQYQYRFTELTQITADAGAYERLFLLDDDNQYTFSVALPSTSATSNKSFIMEYDNGVFALWRADANSSEVSFYPDTVSNRDELAVTEDQGLITTAGNYYRFFVAPSTPTDRVANAINRLQHISVHKTSDTQMAFTVTAPYLTSTEMGSTRAVITGVLSIPDTEVIAKIKVMHTWLLGIQTYSTTTFPPTAYNRPTTPVVMVSTVSGNLYVAGANVNNLFQSTVSEIFPQSGSNLLINMAHFSDVRWDGMLKDFYLKSTTKTSTQVSASVAGNGVQSGLIAISSPVQIAIVTNQTKNRLYLYGCDLVTNTLDAGADDVASVGGANYVSGRHGRVNLNGETTFAIPLFTNQFSSAAQTTISYGGNYSHLVVTSTTRQDTRTNATTYWEADVPGNDIQEVFVGTYAIADPGQSYESGKSTSTIRTTTGHATPVIMADNRVMHGFPRGTSVTAGVAYRDVRSGNASVQASSPHFIASSVEGTIRVSYSRVPLTVNGVTSITSFEPFTNARTSTISQQISYHAGVSGKSNTQFNFS